MTKIICTENCGNSPKNLFLRDFNIAVAKRNFSVVHKSLAEDVSWELFEPSGQKKVTGRENVLREYKESLVLVPAEFFIDIVITHGYHGAVNGRIKASKGTKYVFSDFYEFSSAKGTAIKRMISYIIKVKE